MKTYKHILVILIITFGLIACQTDDSNTDTNTESLEYYQELNISYGSHSDQKFDVYLPANRTLDTKVMILVHGGGWSGGDKSDMNGFKDFVQAEFSDVAVVNINYRLADVDNHPYPKQLNDITSVVNHLKTNQSTYVIANEFGFLGVSAGGHLSLLWSYAFDTQNNVNMVCSVVGPTNFTDPAYLNNTNPDLQALLDLYAEGADTNFLELTSPLFQATASSPPTIMFYGGQDPLVPTTQGTAMRDKLIELGVEHQFTLYPNAAHGWIGLELLDTGIKLKAFMQTYL